MKKVIPITGEELKEVFSSRHFLGGIKRATKIGLERHTESQFLLSRGLFSGKLENYFPNGSIYDLPASCSFEIDEDQTEGISRKKQLPLVHYHCHATPNVHPSESDLKSLFVARMNYNFVDTPAPQMVENYHLEAIGGVREKGKFHDVFVMQNRSGIRNPDEGEFVYHQVEDLLREREDYESLVQAFDSIPNWKAHFLTYVKEGSVYTISENQLKGLEKFAYTPKILEE